MKSLYCFFIFFVVQILQGQQLVKGYIVDALNNPFPNCRLSIKDLYIETLSDENGFFSLETPVDFLYGDLIIEVPEGIQQIVPLNFESNKIIDLGYWKVDVFQGNLEEQSVVDWDVLFEDDVGLDRDQIGSILLSQRDVFLNTVAFQFSPTFYRMRGLDPTYQEVRLNGIPMQSYLKGPLSGVSGVDLMTLPIVGNSYMKEPPLKFTVEEGFYLQPPLTLNPQHSGQGLKFLRLFQTVHIDSEHNFLL